MPVGAGQMRDRARVLSKTNTGTRVEGGYQKVPTQGPWFRCTYDPGNESEDRSAGGVRRRRRGATVTCGRRALDGSMIEVTASDRIELDSPRYGSLVLDITDTPEPVVPHRLVTGWTINVGKTERSASG